MKQLRERIFALGMALCLCLSLCAVPASAAVDKTKMPGEGTYGTITLSRSLRKSNDTYTVSYTAKTKMVNWLAQAAAVCKDDSRMADLRFTCTLKDALTAKLTSVGSDEYDFDSAKYNNEPIFELDVLDEQNAVWIENGTIKLRYKLNPTVLADWGDETTQNVKDAFRQQMTMTATKSVPVAEVGSISSSFKSTARIDITIDGPEIPFYHESSIFAAYGEYSVSGGDDSVPPAKPTVEVVNKTQSAVDPATGKPIPSDVPVGSGTTTVENPDAKPGEKVRVKTKSDKGSMVNYISVKDEDGNRVPVAYEGEGKFTFEMPENGNVTIEADYRVIPADPKETGVASLLDTDHHILYMIGDDKGDFRPNASISRAEVATSFFRLLRDQNVEITQHFGDVSAEAWYVQPIETLAALHIIEGVGNGNYQPNRPITRAEFAAVAARFANELTKGKSFTDVDQNEWYADYVSTAASFGWINGVGNGNYEPNRPITRTEAAAIINRMLLRISDWIEVDAGAGRHFPDVDENFWGRYEISEATNGHDHTLEEEYFHENWLAEDWREAVDNDPVNFGQPKF